MQTLRFNAMRPLAILATTVVLTSAASTKVSAAPYKSAKGYQITAPKGWATRPGMMGAEVIFMNPDGTNINVVSQPVPRGTTVEKARADSITLLGRIMNKYKMIGKGTSSLGGTRALTLSSGYQMGTPPQSMRAYQVFTIRNSTLFVFTCTARNASYAKYNSTFQNTLATVRWTK